MNKNIMNYPEEYVTYKPLYTYLLNDSKMRKLRKQLPSDELSKEYMKIDMEIIDLTAIVKEQGVTLEEAARRHYKDASREETTS